MLPLRKELGILMGVLALVHGFSYLIPYGETMQLFSDGKPSFLLFGIIAMWLSVPLTLTSSTWAIRKMGRHWKTLHRLTYLVVIFAVAHVVILKSMRQLEVAPVIFLALYFVCKILEWRGYSFAKRKENIRI
jgi:methionine sulfoxide reductase heme-binding subunit